MRESQLMSLVLPLFNEAEGVERIIAALTEVLDQERIPYQLVLVNNGSTDETGLILAELAHGNSAVHVTTVPVNEGYGWGILCGLREATGDIVGFMCADGQVAPRDIAAVYRSLIGGNADLSKVVRVSRQDGFKRYVMSVVYNGLFRFVFGIKARDINGTPKLMWRTRFAELELTSKDWFIDAELMIGVTRLGFQVSEVEVDFLPRNHGDSNVRLSTSLEFLRNMLLHWFRSRRGRA
jgi:glycosyltransferase involved in cell wall biosynthesis